MMQGLQTSNSTLPLESLLTAIYIQHPQKRGDMSILTHPPLLVGRLIPVLGVFLPLFALISRNDNFFSRNDKSFFSFRPNFAPSKQQKIIHYIYLII